MKLARPTEEIFESVREFKNACEVMLLRERFSLKEPYHKWEDLDDDDNDKKYILRLRKDIAKEEGLEEHELDMRIVAYEFLKRKYSSRLEHVLITAEVLTEQCCDPTISYCDFYPSLEERHVSAEQ